MANNLPPPMPPSSQEWRPHPNAVARENEKKDEKDTQDAIRIMRITADFFKDKPNMTADDLANACEVMWRWATSDTWPVAK